MSGILKNLLQIGTGANIRTFLEDGAHINRTPLKEVECYSVIGVQANVTYNWDFSAINHDVIPHTLFGYKSTPVNQNDSLLVTVKDGQNNIVWQLQLSGKVNVLGNAFYFEFPFCCISREHTASMSSAVALNSFSVFGEKAFMNPYISPSYLG